ncbi:uncharacterized protein LOC117604381 [Osmia lignaria lignaria]|uniref:uncharacterized protein LOC117604381 n=1 Tax=Osmia lignaria lignaria TaxID=1437193 RepID=UPI0014789066|nr:nucleophosmin-like [Osmia lignaria]
MNWKDGLHRVEEDGDEDDGEKEDDDDDDGDEYDTDDDNEGLLGKDNSYSASSGRRVAARDSRAGEEDWTKRKKQNKTSKAEEAEEHKSKRRAKARRVEAGLRRK